MREGSLEAPTRHPIPWEDPDFYDEVKLDEEMRRVLDICHGCRRCFNLCDSFPRLFDLVDESPTDELDSVKSEDFKPIVDACTLCDLCYMTKCPYVPPHEFNLDFPHLMLRYRAVELKKGDVSAIDRQLTETDRNGKLASLVAPIANWGTSCDNKLTRKILEKVADIDPRAELPRYAGKTFEAKAKAAGSKVNTTAPGHGRKAVIYATCSANYNEPDIGMAAKHVLEANGVEVEVVYPECCGMPQLEHGDLSRVAAKARNVAANIGPWIAKGYDVIALVPSCALMLKSEWPLLLPDDETVKLLAQATYDIPEYLVELSKDCGLAPAATAFSGDITVHIACHARAQNMGRKAEELLKLVPGANVKVIERCSGHGGSWGVKCGNYDTALKVGKPVAREAAKNATGHVVSECPLARVHILQGMKELGTDVSGISEHVHPIELMATAYGWHGDDR